MLLRLVYPVCGRTSSFKNPREILKSCCLENALLSSGTNSAPSHTCWAIIVRVGSLRDRGANLCVVIELRALTAVKLGRGCGHKQSNFRAHKFVDRACATESIDRGSFAEAGDPARWDLCFTSISAWFNHAHRLLSALKTYA